MTLSNFPFFKKSLFSRPAQEDPGSLQFRGLMTEAQLAEAFVNVARNDVSGDSADTAFAIARSREALEIIDQCLISPGAMSEHQVELLNERRSLLQALLGSLSH